MSLTVKDKGGVDFEKVPQGTHLAVCDMVVDLGLQKTEYMGRTKVQPKVYLRWEIPAERIKIKKDDREVDAPMVIGATYTASLSEKATLRKHLESWRGRAFTEDELNGFHLGNILGKPCQVTVTHRQVGEKTYANVTAVTSLPKGVPAPKAENEPIKYSPEEPDAYELLPKWMKEKIGNQASQDEEETVQQPSTVPEDYDSEVPF